MTGHSGYKQLLMAEILIGSIAPTGNNRFLLMKAKGTTFL
jgi:hypothetical protein